MQSRINLLFISLMILASCKKEEPINTGCLSTGLQNGLLAFYPFSTGLITDESGNNNDLTNPTTASPTTDRFNNTDCAYSFNNLSGPGEFLTRTSSGFLNGLNVFSVSVWYQPIDTLRDGGAFEMLLGRGDTFQCPDRNGEWSVGLYDCRKAVFGHNNSVWANNTTNTFQSCNEIIKALTGQWHHVVAVKNNNGYKLYFNGQLENSVTGNAVCGVPHLAQDIGDVILGKYFNGKIDDVLIYNRELSQNEVTELYGLEGCCQ